ncbi:MAG: hypothetical protein PHS64_05035 [Candidatus Omnitrophica bacterium]|nr:hypothetical protein [Candidatus Omnitrophota bacterium]MDD5775285.1 hypothetical protein [Candidatus Omnitrophota bacterium]
MRGRFRYFGACVVGNLCVTLSAIAAVWAASVVFPPDGLVAELSDLMFAGTVLVFACGAHALFILYRLIRFYLVMPAWRTMCFRSAGIYAALICVFAVFLLIA